MPGVTVVLWLMPTPSGAARCSVAERCAFEAFRRALQAEMESLKEAKAILELDSFHSKATRLVEILTSKDAVTGGS